MIVIIMMMDLDKDTHKYIYIVIGLLEYMLFMLLTWQKNGLRQYMYLNFISY